MDWFEAETPEPDSFIAVNSYGKGITLFRGDSAKRVVDDKLYSKSQVLELAFKSKAAKGLPDIDKTDLSEKKAPLITKYTCDQAPEGYNFVIIKNDDKEQKYKESVNYSTFEGLTFVDHPDQTSYELTVGPGETKIVLMEAKVQGFSTAASMTSQVFHGKAALTALCKSEGDKAQRGDSDPIFCYSLQHDGGMFYLYVNETSDKKYKEEITFDIEGLAIADQEDQKQVKVEIGPGESRAVSLVATGGPWKIG